MSHLLAFLIGALSSLFVETIKHRFFLILFKIKKKIGFDSHFHILNENEKPLHMNYDNIILPNVDEEEFSTISSNFIKEGKNTEIIITNIKQPEWFYSIFSNSVSLGKGRNKSALDILNQFEKFVENKLWKNANDKLEELIVLFYRGNQQDFDVFPHLRSFGNSVAKKVRISFFDLNINDPDSIEKFMKKNEKRHVLFFEKFINYETESLYQRINKYKGTDALIINSKIILNHDDSINELHYQTNSFLDKIKSGFFYNVIENYRDKGKQYKYTFEIFEKIKDIDVKE